MYNDYAIFYTEDAFWDKIKLEGRVAGPTLCNKAFVLYFLLKRKSLPESAKNVITEALGYFISPDDIIPDFVPAVGYNDDMDKIIEATNSVSEYIDEDVVDSALAALNQIFPDKG